MLQFVVKQSNLVIVGIQSEDWMGGEGEVFIAEGLTGENPAYPVGVRVWLK